MEKLKNTALLRNDVTLLSDLQLDALTSLVRFAHDNVNYGCKCIALEAKQEGATILVYGSVREFFHPCLVSVLFACPALI